MTRLRWLLAALVVLAPLPAVAGPILAGTVNGILFCATDNDSVCTQGVQLPDLDPTVGSLTLGTTTLGGVTVSGSTHTSVTGPTQDILNSQSLQIINTTGGTIFAQVAIGDIDYVGPISSIQQSGSGTWQTAEGSTIDMGWWADATNTQGAEAFGDFPGTLLSTYSDVAGSGVDSFSTGSLLDAFNAAGPFSMTTAFRMNLVSGGQLISRGQTMIADITPVPEPATMILLGTGLLAAVRARRRRT